MREIVTRVLARSLPAGVLLAGWAVLLAPAAGAAAQTGTWRWPLDGAPAVVRPFAPGPTPYSPGHYGADLRGSPGQVVRAAGAGTVSYAGLVAGRGVVVVQHGRLRTTYEPVAAGVRMGQTVGRGTAVGRLRAGHACPGPGTCLHWGLRQGDVYLDPVRLVRAGPVRLLPVPHRALRPGAGPAVEGVPSLPSPPRAPTPPSPTGPSSDHRGLLAAAGLAAAGAAAARAVRPL